MRKLQVQSAQRLVQQQHLRLVDQRARNRHALLLPAGELLHAALAVAAQVHKLQHFIHAFFDLGRGYLGDALPEGDIVLDVQVGEERVFLKNRIDLALVGGEVGNILSLK